MACFHLFFFLYPSFLLSYLLNSSKQFGGGRVVRWCWVNFQCQASYNLDFTVGQGPTALVVGAGGGCLDIFTLIYPFLSSFSLSLGDGPI